MGLQVASLMRLITLPTVFTLFRFFLIPLFAWEFLKGQYLSAVLILGAAGLTDFLDGFLARRLHQRSRLGSMLDPLADKFMMLISYCLLSQTGYIPWIVTGIIIGRDFFILAGAALLTAMRIKLYFKPTRLSKVNTTFQILLLVITFLEVFMENDKDTTRVVIHKAAVFFGIESFLTLATIALTVITTLQYAYVGYKFLRYGERKYKA